MTAKLEELLLNRNQQERSIVNAGRLQPSKILSVVKRKTNKAVGTSQPFPPYFSFLSLFHQKMGQEVSTYT